MPFIETPIRTARGRTVMVSQYSALVPDVQEFAEPRAGQKLRAHPDRFDRVANQYQVELTRVYDQWQPQTRRALVSAMSRGATPAELRAILDARLQDLATDLQVLGRRRIMSAGRLGLGQLLKAHADAPQVLLTISRLQTQNDNFVLQRLIPRLQSAFLRDLGRIPTPIQPAALQEAVRGLLAAQRFQPAQYSGGATLAIFEVQRVAGLAEDQRRRSEGEPDVRVRWVLEPGVDHCEDSGGRFGCPSLEGVYEGGWNSLPTVPAGNVTCLGNCRCRIEVDLGKGWRRVA